MTIAARIREAAERVTLATSNEDQCDQGRQAKIDRLQELVSQGLESGQAEQTMTAIRDMAKTRLDTVDDDWR